MYPFSLVKGTGRQSSSLARKEWAIRVGTTAGDCGRMLNSDPERAVHCHRVEDAEGNARLAASSASGWWESRGARDTGEGNLCRVVRAPHRRACLNGTHWRARNRRGQTGAGRGRGSLLP